MKHFRFGDKIETSLIFSLFISRGLRFRDVRLGVTKTQTGKQIKQKNLSSSQSKMFYGHAMFIGGNSQKGSGLSLSRPVDTKTDFNLNNIIATLSLISISSVKKKIRRQMS